MKKCIKIGICIALVFAGIFFDQRSPDNTKAKLSPDCSWGSFNGNPEGTNSKSGDCLPDMDEVVYMGSYEFDDDFVYLLHDKYAVVWCENKLYCINSDTMELQWKHDKRNVGYYVITDGKVIADIYDTEWPYDGALTCFNIHTGGIIWENGDEGEMIQGIDRLYPYKDDILVVSRFGYLMYLGLIDAETGKITKTLKIDKTDEFGKDTRIRSTDSLEDILFMSSERLNGEYISKLELMNIRNGNTKHEFTPPDGVYFYDAMLHDNKIYTFTKGGWRDNNVPDEYSNFMICYDTWQSRKLWENEYKNGSIYIDSISNDGIIATHNNKTMFCINPQNGRILWENERLANQGNIVTVGNKVFYSDVLEESISDKLEMYVKCLDIKTGDEVWQGEISDSYGSVKVSSGRIFAATSKDTGWVRDIHESDGYRLYSWGMEKPKGIVVDVNIAPESVVLCDSQEIQFEVEMFDSTFAEADKDVTWAVFPKSVGEIDDYGFFVASGEEDECKVVASCDGAYGVVEVEILHPKRLILEPKKIFVRPGQEIDFEMRIYGEDEFERLDYRGWWSVGNDVGTVTRDGLFTASMEAGKSGTVICWFGNLVARAEVSIIDPDMENAITIKEEILDFGNLFGKEDNISKTIHLTNNIKLPVVVTFRRSSWWISAVPVAARVEPMSTKEIKVSVDASQLLDGDVHTGELKAIWDGGIDLLQIRVDKRNPGD